MMKFKMTMGAAVVLTALLAVLSGCQKQEGPAEKAGQKIDKAAEKAGEKIEQTGEKIKDAAKPDKK
jgi:outer membrane murein-binding lipoprotein Lpp